MPAGGSDKSRSNSGHPSRRRKSRRRAASARSADPEVDILSPAAMTNIYYISHNAMDCLEFRGFGWPEAHRGKKSRAARKSRNSK